MNTQPDRSNDREYPWRKFCLAAGMNAHWYSDDTETAEEDFEACHAAARIGEKRAKQMVIDFIKWKLKR